MLKEFNAMNDCSNTLKMHLRLEAILERFTGQCTWSALHGGKAVSGTNT